MDRFAFVKSYSVGYYGSITIDLYKCKKDGTKSSHTDWVRSSEIISKAK